MGPKPYAHVWAKLGAPRMVFCRLPTILQFPKVEAKTVYVMAPHTGFGIKQVQVFLLRGLPAMPAGDGPRIFLVEDVG